MLCGQQVTQPIDQGDGGEGRRDQDRPNIEDGAWIEVKLVPLTNHQAPVSILETRLDSPLVWLNRNPSQTLIDLRLGGDAR